MGAIKPERLEINATSIPEDIIQVILRATPQTQVLSIERDFFNFEKKFSMPNLQTVITPEMHGLDCLGDQLRVISIKDISNISVMY